MGRVSPWKLSPEGSHSINEDKIDSSAKSIAKAKDDHSVVKKTNRIPWGDMNSKFYIWMNLVTQQNT